MSKEKKKVNTSLRLDKKTLKALKLIAVEKETSVQAIIEKLILDYLKKMKEENK
ncbi:MAG: ribbon-helix-helix protein, CopG family [Desulfobacteraceae bacterium]|nr:MAG: ribbon-helix-helix protein, CopG family [Desulfobacteraceae bacterium]